MAITSAMPSSSLFRLPEKVRNKIYAMAMSFNTPISIHKHSTSCARFDAGGARLLTTTWRFTPALLHTCRPIRSGAAPIFYSNNIFVATIRDADMSELLNWLQETNATHVGHVNCLVLNIEPTSVADLLGMVRASSHIAIRQQGQDLVRAMRQAGLTMACVKVNTPKIRHMSIDALLLRFGIDYAETMRSKWLSALEDELQRIEEDEVIDRFRGLSTGH